MADETPPQQNNKPPERVYKKRGNYKAKNGLDGFLQVHIGGKYKHRRYAIFTDYLIRARKHSQEEAEQIIANYKEKGIPQGVIFYSGLIDEIQRWKQICRKERADNAIAARWKKKNQNSEQK